MGKEEVVNKVISVITDALDEPDGGGDAVIVHKRGRIDADDAHKVATLNILITNPNQCKAETAHVHIRTSDDNLGEFLKNVVDRCRNIEGLWTDATKQSPGLWQVHIGYS